MPKGSYAESRDAFIGMAVREGYAVSCIHHPFSTTQHPIVTTVATRIPDHAEAVLMIISGTHGVEGPLGHLVQEQFLSQHLYSHYPNVGSVLVHALNPWGWDQGRRVDDSNIDVNRGCIDEDDGKSLSPNPYLWATDMPRGLGDLLKIIRFFLRIRKDSQLRNEVVRLVAEGQRSIPSALFYGGTAGCWSGHTLRGICSTLPDHIRALGVVDIHTGRGEYGKQMLLTSLPEKDRDRERLARWLKIAPKKFNNELGYEPDGTVIGAIASFFPGQQVFPVAVEVGTVSEEKIILHLLLENWFYQASKQKGMFATLLWLLLRLLNTRRRFAQCFFPNNSVWLKYSLGEALETIQLMLDGLTKEMAV